MRLYEKDFCKPNYEEIKAYNEYLEFHSRGVIDYSKEKDPIKKFKPSIREFIFRAESKFPNNVFFRENMDTKSAKVEANLFKIELDKSTNESDIQSYIKNNRKWYIPASIIKGYNFGHKENYIFPEMKFGSSYVCDYLICGRNSDGYNLLFIEFEDANVNFVNSDMNRKAKGLNSGLGQIDNWKLWLSDNRQFFLNEHGFTDKNINVPLNRIFFCLVVGRRKRMSTLDRNRKNQLMYERSNLTIINYDRIVDYMEQLNFGYCGLLSEDTVELYTRREGKYKMI